MNYVNLLVTSFLLAACGGGSGAPANPVAPVSPVPAATTYAIKQAYLNDFLDTKPYSFSVSGTITISTDNPPSSNSGEISGNGSVNSSPITGTTFDNTAAQSKAKTPSGSITVTEANGAISSQTLPALSATQYLSATFDLLGFTTPAAVVSGNSVPASFSAAAAPISIPTTGRVGDVGTAGVINAYASSAKGQVLGTTTITYGLEGYTASAALLRLTQTSRNAAGVITSTKSDTYQITPAGDITRLKQETRTTLSVNGITQDLLLTYTY